MITSADAFTPAYGDVFDNEGFRIATSLFTIPCLGSTPAAVWVPGARYATSVSVRFVTPSVVEITRDGKGDKLLVDVVAAQRGMTPVCLGAADAVGGGRQVATVGFDMRNQVFPVTEASPDGDRTTYKDTEVQALAWLGVRFLV